MKDRSCRSLSTEECSGQVSLLGITEDLSFMKGEKLLISISSCETIEEPVPSQDSTDSVGEMPPSITDLMPKEEQPKEEQPKEEVLPTLPAVTALAVPAITVKEMQLAALCFLENQLARQLAVAWVSCSGNEARWLEAAGIERALFNDANRLCAALRMNNICQDGGITDSRAIQYIQQIAAEPLLKQGRRNDKSSKR